MPASGNYTNTSAIFQAAVPQRSYAQLNAMRDRELQLGAIQEERARQTQTQNAALIQQQQDFINQINNQPLEAPDKQRVKLWMNDKIKELSKHIENRYPGREGDFFEAEGQMWMKNTLNDLVSSDLYQVAQSNKENVAMAREAIKKNENLTGRFENGKYVPAENQLLEFMQGKKPTFQFEGSYKPDSQFVYDYFNKMDNPYGSKYDRNAFAPEQDVLNVVTGKYGDKNGRDLFYRQFQGRSVPFKRYSLEDQQLFNLDVANKNSTMAARRASTAQGWARLDLQRQKQQDDKDANPTLEQGMAAIVGSPVGTTEGQLITAPLTQNLKTIGKPIASLVSSQKSQGAANFEALSGIPMQSQPTLEFEEISGITLSAPHQKYANLVKSGGKVKEGILSDGTVLDLSKVPHKISGLNPNIFVDQAEANRVAEATRTTGRSVFPDHEFRKASVFIKAEDFDKAGIPRNSPDIRPVYTADPNDKDEQVLSGYNIDVMSPSKGFFQSKEVQNLVNKGMFGQKRANDITDQSPGVDDFQSSFDNTLDND